MHIAVFGATGRTGQPLVEQALERDHEVVAFVRDAVGLPSTIREGDRVSVVEGDAYSGENVERVLGRPPRSLVEYVRDSAAEFDQATVEGGTRHAG